MQCFTSTLSFGFLKQLRFQVLSLVIPGSLLFNDVYISSKQEKKEKMLMRRIMNEETMNLNNYTRNDMGFEHVKLRSRCIFGNWN